MGTKKCSHCKLEKPLNEFYKNRSRKDGLQAQCKKCCKETVNKYRNTHRRQRNEYAKRYRKNHLEQHREKDKKYRNNYPERRRETQRKYSKSIIGNLRSRYMTILARCNNSKCKSYPQYGDKGIQCLFKDFNDFADYILNVLKIDPRGKHIHRIDSSGNYEPGNIQCLSPMGHIKAHGKFSLVAHIEEHWGLKRIAG